MGSMHTSCLSYFIVIVNIISQIYSKKCQCEHIRIRNSLKRGYEKCVLKCMTIGSSSLYMQEHLGHVFQMQSISFAGEIGMQSMNLMCVLNSDVHSGNTESQQLIILIIVVQFICVSLFKILSLRQMKS